MYEIHKLIIESGSNTFTTWLPPILTFVGVLLTLIFNFVSHNNKIKNDEVLKQKELKGNILSKARIEWLSSARNITSEYIASFYSITQDLPTRGNTLTSKQSENVSRGIYENNRLYYTLKLYYTVKDEKGEINEDHKILVRDLEKAENQINSFINSYLYQFLSGQIPIDSRADKEIDKVIKELEILIEDSTIYFKKVWEEAKSLE
ncbi:hypothetical protein [Macrococcoides caseolyticum]|uniref:hypothetical protein n=1 Tax=Macrococcoides caseolyticum TaxID=69966 RepID=UPI000C3365A0|nr:hypothetical protein [Macrococcus caseolyticus]PKF08379.1 hypothetical protein CW698_01175 [Macrococcus caseolyticus]